MGYIGQTITDVFPTSVSLDTVTTTNLTATNATASTSLKTPLVEFTDGDDAIAIADTGVVTMPNQPAFNAYLSATQSNVALNSNVTLQFGTERFDQNADFNTSNYTFTAPVTGRYQLNVTVYIMAVDTAADYYYINLLTSNDNYYATFDPGGFSTDISYLPFQISQLVDMDASDTASVRILQQGASTQQTDINGNSFFSGYLVA